MKPTPAVTSRECVLSESAQRKEKKLILYRQVRNKKRFITLIHEAERE